MSAGRLVVCPTPIGNLEDITLRVLAALRVGRRGRLRGHAPDRRAAGPLRRDGVARALPRAQRARADAGAGRADARRRGRRAGVGRGDAARVGPGVRLVQGCVAAGLEVEVLPGPSAALAALVASALPSDVWRFVGFLPRKRAGLVEVFGSGETVVAFESPRRVAASLAVLAAVDRERPVAVCRELTKLHEEVVRGTACELAARYASAEPRGEVVLVIGGAPRADGGATRRGRRGAAAGGVGRARPGGGGGRGGAHGRAGERALQGRRRALTSDINAASAAVSGAACCVVVALRHQRSASPVVAAARCVVVVARRRISALCNDSAPTQRRSAHIRPPPAAPPPRFGACAPPRPRPLFPSRLRSPQSWPRSWCRRRSPPPPWPSDGCGRSQARWRARSTTPARAPFAPGAHRGADLAAPPGTAVRAACAGRVVHAGPVAGRGVVSVRCGARRVTPPAARGRSAVRAGARVRAGAPIGTLAAGHGGLHLGVRAEGDPFGYVDPMTLLPARRASPRAGRGTPAPRPPAHDPPAAARWSRDGARAGPAAHRPGPAAARRAGGPAAPPRPGRSLGGHGARGLRRRRVAAPSWPSAAGVPARSAAALRTSSPPRATASRLDHVLAESGRDAADPRSPRCPPFAGPARRAAELETRPGSNTAPIDSRRGAARRAANPAAPLASGLRHGLLRHDAHLLRERGAAPGPRLHDDRGRHPRPAPPPARRGGVLPHGHRRARRAGREGRRARGGLAEGARRPQRAALPRPAAADQRVQRLLHPHLGPAPQGEGPGGHAAGARQRPHVQGPVRGLVLPQVRGLQDRERRSRRATRARSTASRSTASTRRTGSSALSTFEEPLKQLYAERPEWVAPRTRYNEALAFINGGLQDVSLSRGEDHLGRRGPVGPGPRLLRLVRRAPQLLHGALASPATART